MAPLRRPPAGRLVFGLLLLVIGLGWLLEALGWVDVAWGALLPAGLIAVGVALIAGARTGRHGGLITLGIILTFASALVAAIDLPLGGGVGQSVVRPESLSEIQEEGGRFDLAMGQLVIDLTDLLPSEFAEGQRVEIEAGVGMGELVVQVPEDIGVAVRARAGFGDVQVLGEQSSGVGPEEEVSRCPIPAGELADRCPEEAQILLDLSVGFGSVKVNQ